MEKRNVFVTLVGVKYAQGGGRTMSEVAVKPAVPLCLKSLADLVRFLVAWSRERGTHIFHFEKSGKHVYGALIGSFPGYYELRGLPLFIYFVDDKPPKGNFIRYIGHQEEKVEFVDAVEVDPKATFIPVIHLASPPAFVGEL